MSTMWRSVKSSEDGLGMTELAVAIVVLGIVLVGLFPLVVDSIRLAQSNAEAGQANRLVSSNIDSAHSTSLGGTCTSGVFTGSSSLGGLLVSADGLSGDLHFSCAGNADGLVTVRVDVWRATDATKSPISTATTKVAVL